MRSFKSVLLFFGMLLPAALSACQGSGSPVSEEEGEAATISESEKEGEAATFGAVIDGAVTVTLSDAACGSEGTTECLINVEIDDSPVLEEVNAADYQGGGEINFKVTGSTLTPVIPSTIKILTKSGTDSASPTALNTGQALRVTVSRPNGEAIVYDGVLSDASTAVSGVLFRPGTIKQANP